MGLGKLRTKAAKVLASLLFPTGWLGLRLGIGMAIEHKHVLRLQPWQTIVDVGANRGQFALAALRYNSRAIVHSFEPLSRPAAIFSSLMGRRPGVQLHRLAVGPTESVEAMYVADHDDSSSLLPIGKAQISLFPGTKEVAREEVQVRPLNAVLAEEAIKGPALLKIDVQGYELGVLEGSRPILSAFDAVYVECSYRELYDGQPLADAIIAWLRDQHFTLKDVLNTTRDANGCAIQSDLYFEASNPNWQAGT